MTITLREEISLAAAIPGAIAALNLAVPQLQAQIDALLAFNPGAINFATDLQVAVGILADINGGIALGITPPSISAQISILLALLAPLQANLAAIAAFQALLSASVFAYGYSGPTNQFGTEMATELTGGFPGHSPAEQCNALVLGTTSAATYSAMAGVFVGF
jgi:hypothetical protein